MYNTTTVGPDKAVEMIRRQLMAEGMKPNWLGRWGRKKVEFISFPWQAGRELFVLVRKPNQPDTVECITVDEVKPLGEVQPLA